MIFLLKNRQKDKIKAQLLDLLKTNSKRNVNELNKVVISLINVDIDFIDRV